MTIRHLFITIAIVAVGSACLLSENSSNAGSIAGPHDTMQPPQASKKGFLDNLPRDFEQPTDAAGQLLLREYGSVFVARGGSIPPRKVVFRDEADVLAFQAALKVSSDTIGGIRLDLQTPAMTGLKNAIAEARRAGLSISPRGADSARRGYNQTVSLWASRVEPGLTYWVGKGRITREEAARIRTLTPYEQVPVILKLEEIHIFFAKSLNKSIIYSVAPPGTSQHISMLALDVKEFDNARVRAILANNGWFQTVASDLPHFTYLGVTEAELPQLGLKPVTNTARTFWVPDI
jgi:hypothetical protein